MKQLLTFATLFALILGSAVSRAQHSEMALAHVTHPLASHPQPMKAPAGSLDLEAGQQAAHFPQLAQYLAAHLTYPERAKEHSVEGTLTLEVLICSDGNVLNVRVLKPLGYGCDEAAVEAIATMPAWVPASNYGVAVKSKARLDIDFFLR
jgi:TonB family protein